MHAAMHLCFPIFCSSATPAQEMVSHTVKMGLLPSINAIKIIPNAINAIKIIATYSSPRWLYILSRWQLTHNDQEKKKKIHFVKLIYPQQIEDQDINEVRAVSLPTETNKDQEITTLSRDASPLCG